MEIIVRTITGNVVHDWKRVVAFEKYYNDTSLIFKMWFKQGNSDLEVIAKYPASYPHSIYFDKD